MKKFSKAFERSRKGPQRSSLLIVCLAKVWHALWFGSGISNGLRLRSLCQALEPCFRSDLFLFLCFAWPRAESLAWTPSDLGLLAWLVSGESAKFFEPVFVPVRSFLPSFLPSCIFNCLLMFLILQSCQFLCVSSLVCICVKTVLSFVFSVFFSFSFFP